MGSTNPELRDGRARDVANHWPVSKHLHASMISGGNTVSTFTLWLHVFLKVFSSRAWQSTSVNHCYLNPHVCLVSLNVSSVHGNLCWVNHHCCVLNHHVCSLNGVDHPAIESSFENDPFSSMIYLYFPMWFVIALLRHKLLYSMMIHDHFHSSTMCWHWWNPPVWWLNHHVCWLNRPMVYASWTAIFLGQIAICDALYKAPLLMLKASPSPSLPGIPLPLVRAWSCQARSRSYPRPHPPGWRVVRARSPGIFPQVLAVEKNWCDLMGFNGIYHLVI